MDRDRLISHTPSSNFHNVTTRYLKVLLPLVLLVVLAVAAWVLSREEAPIEASLTVAEGASQASVEDEASPYAPPDTAAPARASDWATRQLYMGHFALTDIDGERFYPFERFSRGAAGLAGAQATPFRVWLEDWSVEAAVAGLQALADAVADQARQGQEQEPKQVFHLKRFG